MGGSVLSREEQMQSGLLPAPRAELVLPSLQFLNSEVTFDVNSDLPQLQRPMSS